MVNATLMKEALCLSATLELAKQISTSIIDIRRHFHAYPELSFREFETSKYAAEKLRTLGYDVRTFAGHTGLIAEYGRGNVTIGIRCEMDASPLPELNRVVYASRNPGAMHACGHDANLACVLGAAELLTKLPMQGKVRIIIQPGDNPDGKPGAVTMLESGCLDGVTSLLGVHVDATLPTQKIGVVSGATRFSEQNFEIIVQKQEFQPPHLVTLELARMVCALAKLPLFASADQPVGEVALTAVTSDKTDGTAEIAGNLMTFNDEIRLQAQSEIVKLVQGFNPDAVVQFGDNKHTAIKNASVVETLKSAAIDLVGISNALDIKRNSWNSQFSMLTENVPGAMIYLGAEIVSSRRSHSSQTFDIDENCLHYGAAVLAETAIRLADKL